jgi:hypothetical protein
MPKKVAKCEKSKCTKSPCKKASCKTSPCKKSQGEDSLRGRPVGSGKYGCETKVIRIPAQLEEEIRAFIAKKIIKADKK